MRSPKRLIKVKLVAIVKEAINSWSTNNVPRLSAALACYTLFSLAPLLIIILSLAGRFYGQEAVQGQLDNQLDHLMGPKAADTIQEIVKSASHHQQSTLAMVIGFGALFVGATGAFAELQAALNHIWGGTAPPVQQNTVVEWLRTRLLSFGMILVIMFLLLVSLVFASAFSAFEHYGFLQGSLTGITGLIGFLISLVSETILFAFIFKMLPDYRFAWRNVVGGAVFTAVLFEIGKWGLGWYLGRESTASSYGVAGSLILVLIWVYYSAMIVLTGAVFTQAHAKLTGASARYVERFNLWHTVGMMTKKKDKKPRHRPHHIA